MTAPAGGELIRFPGAQPPAPAFAMNDWRPEHGVGFTYTKSVTATERYEPITPAAIPGATAQRPGGPTPQLATAVANMELALRAVLIGSAVLVVVLILVRVVGWLA